MNTSSSLSAKNSSMTSASAIQNSVASDESAEANWRVRGLEGVLLALLVVQMGLTQRLWTGLHAYPQIPFFSGLVNWPVKLDLLFLGLSGVGGLLVLAGLLRDWRLPSGTSVLRRTGWGLIAVGLCGLILPNQQRLQVWAWQGALSALCFAAFPARAVLCWLRAFTISLYFYSAVSKIDTAFMQTYGQTLLDGLLQALQWAPEWSGSLRFWLTGLFPLGELVIVALLIWPRTRWLGWLGSLLMHLVLLLIVGPLGLNHHAPVLVWNLFFLVQNTLLFTGKPESLSFREKRFRRKKPAPQTVPPQTSVSPGAVPQVSVSRVSGRLFQKFVTVVMGVALLFPATEWFDVCDIWPGWGLYSARGARVRLYVIADQESEETSPQTAADQSLLPEKLQPFLVTSAPDQLWRMLDLHRWSFQELNAPSYPEDRFQLGVALQVIQNLPAEMPILVQYEATANRWTGKREKILLYTKQEQQQFAERFRLNTRARTGSGSL